MAARISGDDIAETRYCWVAENILQPVNSCDQNNVVFNVVLTLATPLVFLETIIRTLGMIFLSPMLCAGDQASRFYKREFVNLTINAGLVTLIAPFGILIATLNLAALVIETIKGCLKHKSGDDSGAHTRGPIGSSMVGSK